MIYYGPHGVDAVGRLGCTLSGEHAHEPASPDAIRRYYGFASRTPAATNPDVLGAIGLTSTHHRVIAELVAQEAREAADAGRPDVAAYLDELAALCGRWAAALESEVQDR